MIIKNLFQFGPKPPVDVISTELPMPAFGGTRKVTHVVFDLDGVLLDTEKLYSVANSRCLERYGCTFTTEM